MRMNEFAKAQVEKFLQDNLGVKTAVLMGTDTGWRIRYQTAFGGIRYGERVRWTEDVYGTWIDMPWVTSNVGFREDLTDEADRLITEARKLLDKAQHIYDNPIHPT